MLRPRSRLAALPLAAASWLPVPPQDDTPPAVRPLADVAEAATQDDDEDDSKLWSLEDGWLDVSGFLDEKYGFLPLVVPITEPAVGYGAAVGLAFLSSPLGEAKDGYGRPNITIVGGMATENDSSGVALADVRHWLEDRVQTVVGIVDASINLDFHGVADDGVLNDDPLRYELDPTG